MGDDEWGGGTHKHLEVSSADESVSAVVAWTAADEDGSAVLHQTVLGVDLQRTPPAVKNSTHPVCGPHSRTR